MSCKLNRYYAISIFLLLAFLFGAFFLVFQTTLYKPSPIKIEKDKDGEISEVFRKNGEALKNMNYAIIYDDWETNGYVVWTGKDRIKFAMHEIRERILYLILVSTGIMVYLFKALIVGKDNENKWTENLAFLDYTLLNLIFMGLCFSAFSGIYALYYIPKFLLSESIDLYSELSICAAVQMIFFLITFFLLALFACRIIMQNANHK